MIIRTALAALLFLAASVTLQAQEDATDTCDAVYEDILHEYVLQSDGTVVYNYAHKLKLLTPFAFTRAYGESFITYNPTWQKLDVLRSVTRMRDGTKVESPYNAFNEVLPRYAHAGGPFTDLKEMVVTHTGIEAGAVVDFAYKITTKPGMFPGLMGAVRCGEREHIVHMFIRIKVPRGTDLAWAFARDDTPVTVTEDGEYTVYTWERNHIPMIEDEEAQPPLSHYAPVLYFSTVGYDALPPHVLGGTQDAPLPAPAMAEVERVQAEVPDMLARALELRRWVATRIGGMNGPLDILGFHARPPAETVLSNVGSSLDRAVLLAQMCRAAGIEAFPVLFSHDIVKTGMTIQSEERGGSRIDHIRPGLQPLLPCLQLYPHAAVMCRNLSDGDGQQLVLDPVHATQDGPLPEQYLGVYLPLEPPNPEPAPYTTGTVLTATSTASEWTISDELTVSGKTRVRVNGVSSMAFSPDRFQSAAASALSDAGQGMKGEAGEVETDASGETECEVTVNSVSPLEERGGFMDFRIPHAPGGITELGLPVGDANRTTPVDLPSRMQESCRLVLNLPDGVRAASIPGEIEISNNVGSLRSVIKAKGGTVTVTRTLTFSVGQVMPEGYVDLQELLRAWRMPSHNSLLLKKQ